MSFGPFPDQFGGYVQERMLANDKCFERRLGVRDNLSNPQGSIVRREVKLTSFLHFRATFI